MMWIYKLFLFVLCLGGGLFAGKGAWAVDSLVSPSPCSQALTAFQPPSVGIGASVDVRREHFGLPISHVVDLRVANSTKNYKLADSFNPADLRMLRELLMFGRPDAFMEYLRSRYSSSRTSESGILGGQPSLLQQTWHYLQEADAQIRKAYGDQPKDGRSVLLMPSGSLSPLSDSRGHTTGLIETIFSFAFNEQESPRGTRDLDVVIPSPERLWEDPSFLIIKAEFLDLLLRLFPQLDLNLINVEPIIDQEAGTLILGVEISRQVEGDIVLEFREGAQLVLSKGKKIQLPFDVLVLADGLASAASDEESFSPLQPFSGLEQFINFIRNEIYFISLRDLTDPAGKKIATVLQLQFLPQPSVDRAEEIGRERMQEEERVANQRREQAALQRQATAARRGLRGP